MNKLQQGVYATRAAFDKFPTPVKIIVYSGIATIITMAITDMESLNQWWVKYAAIVLGILANIVAWKLLQLNNEK